MGRINAGGLAEMVTLRLPGPAVKTPIGGQKPGPMIDTPPRPARVRLLRAAEKVRYGLAMEVQAWEVTTRALHPLESDPYYQAQTGRLAWKQEEGKIESVEPDERREYIVLLVTNHISV